MTVLHPAGLLNGRPLLMGLALLLCQRGQSHAELALAAPFRDGAVLQHGKPLPVWGTARAGEQVTIKFSGQSKSAYAGRDGQWKVQLDPLPVSADPSTLTAIGENTVLVNDVLVGEVWLCSGQSNMNFPLGGAQDAEREIGEANHPLIRYFDVRSSISPEPLESAEGQWKTCSPETAGQFTAVGYFFARELHRQLGAPVGIIKATLGGSPIEAWMSAEALDSTPASSTARREWDRTSAGYRKRFAEYQQQLAAWRSRAAQAKAAGQPFTEATPLLAYEESDRSMPAGLYNGFIHPLEPLRLAGFLWYQGESNVERAADYRILFPKMIRQWRHGFQQPELPFLFVQLPNFNDAGDATSQKWAWLREAQAAARVLPNVGMAVTIDVGDPADLHPRNKAEVGRRLALTALRQIYKRDVEDCGPVLRDVQREGSSLQLRMDHAKGLQFKGSSMGTFTIAGPDRRFVPAEARIDGQVIHVAALAVEEPIAVRFAWENNPSAALINSAGLPAAPFRSDEW
jgi:sialate O-acetylesterase